ncbi:hypothetical protein HQN89_31225 [Paenibacillus frigoriresistens]|uniref:hypothetical protein n=1 Tax=Paenibacillus alginolyticus TaxID=59839 RepID=UPI001566A352|nr:hypothetical protein [Paenibacillus frigoriresistens]NRF95350.1 hypothetical protein [Paenibacillus frigoriresistens]
MNHTQIMLSRLNAGDLQRLAVDLLPRLHDDWKQINHNGIVEGSSQTRKGTPDAWCTRDNGTYVFIQATGDAAANKIKEDVEKSINELKKIGEIQGALCVAFLKFDPPPKEISAGNLVEDLRRGWDLHVKFGRSCKRTKTYMHYQPRITRFFYFMDTTSCPFQKTRSCIVFH